MSRIYHAPITIPSITRLTHIEGYRLIRRGAATRHRDPLARRARLLTPGCLLGRIVVVAVTTIRLAVDYHNLIRHRRWREARVDFGIDHCQTAPSSGDAGWALEQLARDDPFDGSARQIAAEADFNNLIQKDLRRVQASA